MQKNEYVRVSALLLFALVLFFYRPIFTSDTFIPFDAGQEFDTQYEAQQISAHNYLLTDSIHQFAPFREFARQELLAGRFPFWNPHQGLGSPFFEDPQTRVLDPIRLLLVPFHFSLDTEFLLAALLTLYVMGIALYAFLRSMHLSAFASSAGAIACIFSGPLIVWLQYPLTTAMMWLPVLLLSFERILQGKTSWYVIGSLAIAGLVFSGQPQMIVIEGTLVCAYVIFRGMQLWSAEMKKRMLALAVFIVLGFGVSAVQLLPSVGYIVGTSTYESGRGVDRSDTFFEAARDQFSHGIDSAQTLVRRTAEFGVLFFAPGYYGSPLSRDFRFPEGNPLFNYSEIAIYAGLVVAFFAALSVWKIRKRKVQFWWAVAIMSFGLSAFLPVIGLIGYVPIMNKIHTGRFRFICVFACIVLAGMAIDFFLDNITSKKARYALGALVCGLVFADLFFVFSSYNVGNAVADDQDAGALERVVASHHYRFAAIGTSGGTFRSPLTPNAATFADALYDVRTSNPLRPTEYDAFAKKALTPKSGYILLDGIKDISALREVGVKYYIVPNGVEDEFVREYGLLPLTTGGSLSVLEDAQAQPIAMLRGIDGLLYEPISIIQNGEGVIVSVDAPRDATLTVSVVNNGNWKARVDGKAASITSPDGLHVALSLSAGSHILELEYRPKFFMLGAGITACSLVFLVLAGIYVRKVLPPRP